jgi:imidazolonepropionase-like amidohydrolase
MKRTINTEQPMRAFVLAAAAALVSSASIAAQQQQGTPTLSKLTRNFVSVDAPVIALTHVSLIDGTGTPRKSDQTIVIRDGKIADVGSSVAVPSDAKVIDLTGHTVLPGFVGLHDHTFYTTSSRSVQISSSAPRLYLASGVTTIRTTGSMSPYQEVNLKRAIDVGEIPGPKMFITGPYLTGGGAGSGMHAITTPEEARRTVDYWVDEGATWIKFYTTVSRAAMKAAIDEAHHRGIKATGHLCSVSFREAVSLGIDNLEHGLLTNTDYLADKKPDECPSANTAGYENLDMSSSAVQQTFRDMVGHHVAMTSTLAVWELFVPDRPAPQQRVLDAMSPEVRAEYLAARARLTEPNAFAIPQALFKKAMAYEKAFVAAGGLLAAGVDPTGNGGALPGFGDQRNYELLLETGFTPEQAVQIMTLNGAKVLGIDDRVGSVARGKDADLIVVRGDPAKTPGDVTQVVTVFKRGVGFDSEKLVASVKGVVGIR